MCHNKFRAAIYDIFLRVQGEIVENISQKPDMNEKLFPFPKALPTREQAYSIQLFSLLIRFGK
jgi:hypothetical protein